jgi:alpha-D-xyloside xylohydrolase
MEKNIWSVGVDAWWLDATEPEHQPVEASDYDYESPEGSFRLMRNSFPLYSVGGIYDHQRKLTDARRVMILTRSATAGMQRYGAHVWSGDLESDWSSLRDQVASALNMSLCGIPYHNSDIGGFFSAGNYPDGYRDPRFHQLYGRWMQLAAFTGMMRSHGTNTPREIYRFGERGEADFDNLDAAIRTRYLLLPYLYAQAWKVTSEGASLMRPLFADWPEDTETWRQEEEFLLGNALLVAPVFREDDTQHVYLPEGGWQDFWDGRKINGGVSFDQTVPRDRIPVFVKAGTILPVGPDVQFVAEKPWDDLQVRIYAGADGDFVLYEDEGDGYAYEKGVCSEIPMHWDDDASVLTIGARKGSWPGMPQERQFRVVIVRPDAGTGLDRSACDVAVSYAGAQVRVDLN